MMYASKVTVKREPQQIRFIRTVELPDGLLTIAELSKHLKEGEEFGFREVESGMFGSTTVMDIYSYRLETQEELDARVAKEVRYNENYEIFHAKNKR